MIGGLVPGFKPAGHPDKVNRREERRRAREEQRAHEDEYLEAFGLRPAVAEVADAPGAVPDARGEGAVGGDPRIRRPYAPEEMAEMKSIRSPRYPGDDPEHHHGG